MEQNTTATETTSTAPEQTNQTAQQAPVQGQTPEQTQVQGQPEQTPKKATDWLLDVGLDEDKPKLGEDGKPLLAGKYKDVTELEKAYKNLESQFGKITAVPEKYDTAAVLQTEGLQWKDAAHEAHVTEAFKQMRLSNEQVNGLMKLHRESLSDVLSQYGPPVNPEFEQAALQRQWGQETPSRVKAVQEFARTLPKEVLTTPLGKTAAGMQLLHRLLSQNSSPTVVKETKSGGDVKSMRAELNKLASDPKYYSDPTLQEKARKLSTSITELETSAHS